MTKHDTIRQAIKVYYPEIAKRIKGINTLDEAEQSGLVTKTEADNIATWLWINNGEVENGKINNL